VPAAVDLLGDLDTRIAPANIQCTHALRPVDLVARERKHIDVVLLHINRNLAHSLNCIRVEDHTLFVTQLSDLRDRLNDKLQSELDYIHVNGSMEHRLPGNLNVSFVYVEGESLLMGINDVAVSSGSACTSATLEPSYVLKALGLGDDVAHSSIRFGLGRFNTQAEVDYVAAKVIDIVKKLRELSPLYEMVKEGIDLTKIEWQAH